jgi:ATP-dependent DNA helicase RecG
MMLTDPLKKHFRLDLAHEKALKRLGIFTVADLLFHIPARYEDISDIQSVSALSPGADAVVFGQLSGLKARKAWKSKRPIAEGYLEDGTSRVKLMWFNQPYIAKMYRDGQYVKATGKVTGSGAKIYLANPELEPLDSLPIDRHDSIFKNTENLDDTIYPVYRETKGITSRWFYHAVMRCFEAGVLDQITDPLPEAVRERYKLYEIKTALRYIHAPRKLDHAAGARKRFAFEEVFYIQVQKAKERAAVSAATTYEIEVNEKELSNFVARFPFKFTKAQERAIEEIFKDFRGAHAMSRLLEGDVGSGKTAVAATTAYAVVTSRPPEGKNTKSGIDYGNLQVAYMAPTEILAKQHFESFIKYFEHLPIQVGLITGSGCYKFPSKSDPRKPTKISKTQLLKWVKNGEVPILIGTHALIYKSVEFKHLAYVIIDEQHRFGTNQRKALTKKGAPLPHLLSMTATPIPRTLSLTIYGDLDLTLLDEMPAGRKPVVTKIIGPGQQEPMYEHVKSELQAGRQAYVICPRIDEPDPEKENALNLKSVIAEAERLKKDVFKDARLAVLHGKMTPPEKDKVMRQFLDHEIDVLVATSVVEVGVNVQNATNIIIEGAERFGLSQLHQLRGRVIRGTHQPYCFAVTESKSEKTKDRLKALSTAKNGFELSEYDLQFRGAGELYGSKQSGLSDLGMEALKNLKLVEAARAEARELVAHDSNLAEHKEIAKRVSALGQSLHME